MKKFITAVFAVALAVFTAAVICGCTSSKNSDGTASLPETTANAPEPATTDSAAATTSPKVKPTDAPKKQKLSGEVIKAALDYCKMSAEDKDCVTLWKNEMAHDGSLYHFVYVEKGDTVVPLVISYDAKTVYEPSDFFFKYGTVEEATTEKPGGNNNAESSDTEDDNGYYEEYYDDYYY